jgi:hypothetical protein
MQNQFTIPITYFLEEGRVNLIECLKIAARAAREHNIAKLIIFTARGDGIRIALEEFWAVEDYTNTQLIGVTFPQGMEFTDDQKKPITVEISEQNLELFAKNSVPIIRAHLPFDPIAGYFRDRGVLGQDLSLVGNALSMFGGSMSLCVQAITLACDAGVVGLGEHVIAMTSDTAILAQATCTRKLLTDLVIREILCKPAILTVGRQEELSTFLSKKTPPVEAQTAPKALPAVIDQPKKK